MQAIWNVGEGSPVTVCKGEDRYLYYIADLNSDGDFRLASALHGNDRYDRCFVVRDHDGERHVESQPDIRVLLYYDEPEI